MEHDSCENKHPTHGFDNFPGVTNVSCESIQLSPPRTKQSVQICVPLAWSHGYQSNIFGLSPQCKVYYSTSVHHETGFHFHCGCRYHRESSPIEPLFSGLRHPKHLCFSPDDRYYVVNKEYLLIQSAYTAPFARSVQANVYIFDLGASLYGNGTGGASQQWFVVSWNHCPYDESKIHIDI